MKLSPNTMGHAVKLARMMELDARISALQNDKQILLAENKLLVEEVKKYVSMGLCEDKCKDCGEQRIWICACNQEEE